MKKIILCLFVLISFFLKSDVCFASFQIDEYFIDINVSETNLLNIKERINTTFFDRTKHGIIRDIPLDNTIYRTDGSINRYRAKISNLQVDKEYSTTTGSDYSIKIGSPYNTVKEKENYIILYDYQIGDDKLKNKDEFYFNIIGNGWDCPIKRVDFKITLPKPFDKNSVNFIMAGYGLVNNDNKYLEYEVIGNTIIGHTNHQLNPYEALTIRMEFPEEYFNLPPISPLKAMLIRISFIFTLLLFLFWFFLGKDEDVIPVVNFYPPDKINSAEFGVMYEGEPTLDHVVSLVFYLANKGYIQIKGENGYYFSLIKLKEYDGKNKYEKMYMDALFAVSDNVSSVSLEKSTTYYKACEQIVKSLKTVKEKIFYPSSIDWFLSCAIPNIFLFLIFSIFVFILFDFQLDALILCCTILFFINIKTMFIRSADRSKKAIYGFYIISSVVAILATYFNILGASWSIELLIPLIFCIIGVACVVEMPKRNKTGNFILGKILGLKKFIEVSEENRIKTLIKENPNYCFNLIPYAIVLGVCKEWILKFQQLMPQNPDWYQGQFNAHSIAKFSYNLSTLSAPSYNNGGISRSSSSGGGGFSGGGGGGGGGSSW